MLRVEQMEISEPLANRSSHMLCLSVCWGEVCLFLVVTLFSLILKQLVKPASLG
jgi:hypothetical protein